MDYTIGTKVFDNWEITKEIGHGSFGTVYVIEKNRFGISTKSALKVIKIPHDESDVRQMLTEGFDNMSVTKYFESAVHEIIHEIDLMSEMKVCENVVHFEDYNVIVKEDGIGWDILIKMELLTPITDRLVEKTLPESEVIRIGIDICKALEYCQKKGIIHRDIKAENIFVNELGYYKLGDFGVAKAMDKTSGGSKKGTENYMAPEVYLSKPYNRTVDIYSLGILLYRLMNNNRPPFYPPFPEPISFAEREKALIERMQGKELPAPVNADVQFAQIILKACSYKSEDRYQSATDMLTELSKLKNESINAESIEAEGIKTENIEIEKKEIHVPHITSAYGEDDKTVGVWGNIKVTGSDSDDVNSNDVYSEDINNVETESDDADKTLILPFTYERGEEQVIAASVENEYKICDNKDDDNINVGINDDKDKIEILKQSTKKTRIVIGGFAVACVILIALVVTLLVPTIRRYSRTVTNNEESSEGVMASISESIDSEEILDVSEMLDTDGEFINEQEKNVVEATTNEEERSETSEKDETVADDPTVKSEGVMTYADYCETATEEQVVVECYVMAHQSWWDNNITVYAADTDGAYFMYNMTCTEENASLLTEGTKIKVIGYKSEWGGEVEIDDATFEIEEGNYIPEVVDVTSYVGSDDLINYMNQKVAFKGMNVETVSYKNETPGDDIYVTLSKDGIKVEFCLEYYLNGSDADLYNLVGNLQPGSTVDVECYLYWYEGANGHLIAVTVH